MLKSIYHSFITKNYPEINAEQVTELFFYQTLITWVSVFCFSTFFMVLLAVVLYYLHNIFSLYITIFIIISSVMFSFAYMSNKKFKPIYALYKFLYFNIYAKKGKALTRKDFKKLKKVHRPFYRYFYDGKAINECYFTSFFLLKLLQKGKMQFLAVRDYDPSWRENCDYHMHVVYVNNGYIFDTDSYLQFPYDKYISLMDAKEFKSFSFEDVKDLTEEEFGKIHHSELVSWCKKNHFFLWVDCPVVE